MAAPDVFSKRLLTSNIKWKGKTFKQISSGIQYNNYLPKTVLYPKLLLKALPLQIYRREIASATTKCNPRTSLIGRFDGPGQTSVTSYSTNTGLALTMDIKYEKDSCQHPTPGSQTCVAFQSVQDNARRRVRSAGMVRLKYNNVSANYFTDTNQYLTNRNRTFQQNQYFHIRQGDPTATPGTLGAVNNIYSANGYNTCPKFSVTTPIIFQYVWLSNGVVASSSATSTFSVTIPVGLYDINSFNNILNATFIKNKHYMVNVTTQTPFFFLQLSYNGNNNRIVLKSYSISASTAPFNTVNYQYPAFSSQPWILPTSVFNPQIIMSGSTIFTNGLGFNPGTYPSTNNNSTDQIIVGLNIPKLQVNYVPIYYKPSNPEFATQGGVSSSSVIARKRYNAITSGANKLRTTFGSQTADALAYGVPGPSYTLKDGIGVPQIKTPAITSKNSQNNCIINRRMRNLRNG